MGRVYPHGSANVIETVENDFVRTTQRGIEHTSKCLTKCDGNNNDDKKPMHDLKSHQTYWIQLK